MNCKYYFSRVMWHVDRVFGDNKRIGYQVLYILAAVSTLIMFVALVGWALPWSNHAEDNSSLIQSIGLVFGATDQPAGDVMGFPVWWQVVAFLLGSVIFNGVTITFVGNLLGNRQEAYRDGSVRYWFKDHVVFLGGGEMVAPMLKNLFCKLQKEGTLKKTHIVVLTDRDVPEVRLMLLGRLSDEERCMKITVLRGRRDDADEQCSIGVQRASRIFIVGEDPQEEDYDSVNIAAWNVARDLYSLQLNSQKDSQTQSPKESKRVPCYMLLERAASEYIFRHNSENMPDCFDTTVVNRLESVAQMMLVHNRGRKSEDKGALRTKLSESSRIQTRSNNSVRVLPPPPLDRGGISADSQRTVHLVLYGMTAFSYAMATMAAHLCHFPNFVKEEERDGKRYYGENLQRRTRITFIAPDIKEERDNMMSHLASLFALSRVTVDGAVREPEEDFLDIEWEFVDGNIADEKMRSLLRQYYRENQEGKTYLTLALCQREASRNIAAALYLPDEFHNIVYADAEGKEVDYEKTIPIFVYQPDSEEQLCMAHAEVPLYRNLFPMGTVHMSYDPSIDQRISEGKRINYLYVLQNKGEKYVSMPLKQESYDSIWPKDYSNQKSNIYSANHIGTKLRSVGIDPDTMTPGMGIPEEDVPVMAVVEHNRWNMEKLLMGYAPVPAKVRKELKRLETEGRAEECAALKSEVKKLRARFQHNCIAPYEQLLEGDKEYDRVIVKHLADVINCDE